MKQNFFIICFIILISAVCSPKVFAQTSPVPLESSGNFFGEVQSSGQITVKLYPMENVNAGSSQLVTFGMPFSRGSVPVSDISKIRVLKNGAEIPAYVQLLTPWRHIANTEVDGQFVRVAVIQINYTFTSLFPGHEEITVVWGNGTRGQNVTSMQPVKNGWHAVSSGSFTVADNTQEPNVYAVLPSYYISQGIFGAPIAPFDPSVAESRDDAQWASSNQMSWAQDLLHNRAAKNFFYSTINEDDPLATSPNTWSNYKTDSEPWLYDRAATFYHLYFASGHVKALREAVRASQFYKSKLYVQGVTPAVAKGIFSLKIPNPAGYIGGNGSMYSYNENLAYSYWLVGDDSMLQNIRDVVEAHEYHTESTRWRPDGLGYFTERHTAFRLRANVVAYEVFGESEYRDNLLAQYNDFIWHQNGAGGVLPANRIDGGLWHTCSEHEGVACNPDLLMASPWMSILTIESMLRAYEVTEDANIADFIRRMGTFLVAATKFNNQHWYNYSGSLYGPDYITLIDGTTEPSEGTQAEHSLEVSTGLAWAGYFGALLDKPDATLIQRARDVFTTYAWSVDNYTRPTAPATAGYTAFRVSPPRKYNWQYHPGLSFEFAIDGPGETTNPSGDTIAPSAPGELQVN